MGGKKSKGRRHKGSCQQIYIIMNSLDQVKADCQKTRSENFVLDEMFVSGSKEAKVKTKSFFEKSRESLMVAITSPLKEYKRLLSFRTILIVSCTVLVVQWITMGGGISYYFTTLRDTKYLSPIQSIGTECEVVPSYVHYEGNLDYNGNYLRSSDNLDKERPFYEVIFELNCNQSEFEKLANELKDELRYVQELSLHNTLAEMYVILATWKTSVVRGESSITLGFRVDQEAIYSGPSITHIYGQNYSKTFNCSQALTRNGLNEDMTGNAVGLKLVIDGASAVEGVPVECAGVLSNSQLGILRTSSLQAPVEYKVNIDRFAASVASAINRGIISKDNLSRLPSNAALPLGEANVQMYSFSYFHSHTGDLVCMDGTLEHPDRFVCAILVGSSRTSLLFPVPSQGMGFEALNKNVSFCTCAKGEANGLFVYDPCYGDLVNDLNFLSFTVLADSPSAVAWWSEPFHRFYEILYRNNPTGNFDLFSNATQSAAVYSAAVTNSLMFQIVEQESVDYAEATQDLVDPLFLEACPARLNCSIIQLRSFAINAGINAEGFEIENNSCNGLLGIRSPDEASTYEHLEAHIDTIVRNIYTESPSRPFQLVESYYECIPGIRAAFIEAVSLSISLVSAVSAAFVCLVTGALMACMRNNPNESGGQYTHNQIAGASEELAFNLLRARDGESTLIREGGSLHMLSKDLMRTALLDSKLVDSDDDLDDLSKLGSRVESRRSRMSANVEGLVADFVTSRGDQRLPQTKKEKKGDAIPRPHMDLDVPGQEVVRNPVTRVRIDESRNYPL